jgi:hypothetical protein
MYLQPLTLTDKKDKIHYHTQSTQSTQHTNNLHQIKGMQEIFRSVDITTPHGQWALNTIAEGSRSLHTQSNTFHRMMTISGAKHYTEVTPDHILRYLFSATRTCVPQSLNTYLSEIRSWGAKALLPWAEDSMFDFLARGLRATATTKRHAVPMPVDIFQEMLNKDLLGDEELKLVAATAYLGGCRLDEVFRYTRSMVTSTMCLAKVYQAIVQQGFIFVAISSGAQSKTGQLDPESLRFVDVLLLSQQQFNTLMTLCKRAPTDDSPIFSRRATLTSMLNSRGFTDHSFKGGTACLLSELIRDGELPEQALSMILKHKNNQDPVQSYTAGYLSVTARLNILQNKDIFKAAVLLRRMIFRDI